jgi:hypothetical protein
MQAGEHVTEGLVENLDGVGTADGFVLVAAGEADLQSHAPADLVQAYLGRQGHQAFGLGPVIADRRDGEDEPAPPEADLLDQNRVAGIGHDDDITGIDVASQDHVIHIVYSTARKDRFHRSREQNMYGI